MYTNSNKNYVRIKKYFNMYTKEFILLYFTLSRLTFLSTPWKVKHVKH